MVCPARGNAGRRAAFTLIELLPAHSEATFTPRPMLTDADFERWGDGVLDVLPMNLLR